VWADKLYTDILDRFGIGTFPKNHVAPNILKILKSGGIVGYVLDQNMKYESGIFVDFFGKKACTLKGLATFAGRYGSPIIPAFIVSHPLGKHHIHIEKPFIPDDAKVMKTRDEEITQYFTGMIEDWVRRYPEQWVWFHGRWKTRPAGEAPVYPKRTKRLKQLRNWCRVHYNAFCRGKGMDKDT
jgi:KDO2-lipid IV(A) lauroyltransferase